MFIYGHLFVEIVLSVYIQSLPTSRRGTSPSKVVCEQGDIKLKNRDVLVAYSYESLLKVHIYIYKPTLILIIYNVL